MRLKITLKYNKALPLIFCGITFSFNIDLNCIFSLKTFLLAEMNKEKSNKYFFLLSRKHLH